TELRNIGFGHARTRWMESDFAGQKFGRSTPRSAAAKAALLRAIALIEALSSRPARSEVRANIVMIRMLLETGVCSEKSSRADFMRDRPLFDPKAKLQA